MKGFLERMIKEKTDLEEKRYKLIDFLSNEENELDKFFINDEERDLLLRQESVMREYILILNKRLDLHFNLNKK